MQKWLVCFMLLASVIACTPPSGEGVDPTRPAKPTSFPIGRIFIRLHNKTDVDFSRVDAIYPNSKATFTDVTAGIMTDYQQIDEAYQLPALLAVAGEREYNVENLDNPSQTGEPPITAGHYTIHLNMTGSDLLQVDLRPETDPAEAEMDELLNLLRQQGLEVQLEPLIQRGTIFDELAGETISNQQILRVESARIDAYIFQKTETANRFAEAIQPGGSSFLFVRDNGEQIERFERAGVGASINWWQTGRFILNYNGGQKQLSVQISAALNSEPLHVAEAGALNIRVSNVGDIDFDQLTIRFPMEEADFGAVPAFSTSRYLPIEQAYHYAGITINANNAESQIMPIDYVGETPLNAGNYTYVIQLVNGEIHQTLLNDDAPYLADELIGADFYFAAAKLADGDLFFPHGSDNGVPLIQFTPDETQNIGESGFAFTGNSGCNSFFGAYHITKYSSFVIQRMGSTAMLCEETAMQTEKFLQESLAGISYYQLHGDFLYWISSAGDYLLFTTERPTGSAPYLHSENAGIAPVLLALFPEAWEIDAMQLEQDDTASDKTLWGLDIFGERIQAVAFVDSTTALAAWQDAGNADQQSWLYDRFIIRYNGDYQLINELLNDAFPQS